MSATSRRLTKRVPFGQKKDVTASYNRFKTFKGSQYTGMQVGRSHTWYYDQGEWKETKITPDLWEIYYSVTKRRAGRAPKGSGVPVGTGYHWFILAHQNVKKLNANDYSTSLIGFKYKIAHKRFNKPTWSSSVKTQRKRLIELLKDTVKHLEHEPIPVEFTLNNLTYKGEAVSMVSDNGAPEELSITLNGEHVGILKHTKIGWKMHGNDNKKFIRRLGEAIEQATA